MRRPLPFIQERRLCQLIWKHPLQILQTFIHSVSVHIVWLALFYKRHQYNTLFILPQHKSQYIYNSFCCPNRKYFSSLGASKKGFFSPTPMDSYRLISSPLELLLQKTYMDWTCFLSGWWRSLPQPLTPWTPWVHWSLLESIGVHMSQSSIGWVDKS